MLSLSFQGVVRWEISLRDSKNGSFSTGKARNHPYSRHKQAHFDGFSGWKYLKSSLFRALNHVLSFENQCLIGWRSSDFKSKPKYLK